MTAADPVPVIVVDDQPDIGEVIRRLLRRHDSLRFAGWLPTPEDLGEAIRAERDDRSARCIIVVLDYNIPGFDADEVMSDITARFPEARIIIFSGETSICREALAAGAAACLGKDAPPAELVGTILACTSRG